MEKYEKVEVLEHVCVEGTLLHHRAKVRLEGLDPKDNEQVEKLAERVSARVGYPPLGYGMYGFNIAEDTNEPNVFILNWKTVITAE